MHIERLQADRAMICGRLLLHPNAARAYWNAEDVSLTFEEHDAILLLASNAPQCVPYEAISDCFRFGRLAAAGEGQNGRTKVRAVIARIRRKFRKIDATFDKIGNHPRIGYCWKETNGALALWQRARALQLRPAG